MARRIRGDPGLRSLVDAVSVFRRSTSVGKLVKDLPVLNLCILAITLKGFSEDAADEITTGSAWRRLRIEPEARRDRTFARCRSGICLCGPRRLAARSLRNSGYLPAVPAASSTRVAWQNTKRRGIIGRKLYICTSRIE
jgi:hypothetical protein